MTTTIPRPAGPRGYGLVGAAADRRIRPLQRGYRSDVASSVSAVARLRRGAGHPAHQVQDLWGAVGTAELEHVLAAAEPAERQGLHADRADEALHLAITLWALHQQSHRDTDTHVVGYGLGRSVRLLMAPDASRVQGETAATGAPQEGAAGEQLIDESLRRRFVRVGTATTLDVLSQRLREIVLLLRKDAVPLDYALLADQLYWWQFPGAQADVRRTWGRDFHIAGIRARSNPRA